MHSGTSFDFATAIKPASRMVAIIPFDGYESVVDANHGIGGTALVPFLI